MIRAALRSIGQDHLDLRFRQGGLTVEILGQPGLWAPPDRLARLTADLRAVAGKTLPQGDLTYGVFSGDPARLAASIITLIRRADGRPVAFNALALMHIETLPETTEVLHLGLVMVDPEERSRSLSWLLYGLTCFLLVLRRQFRPLWVSNVTQVPAIVGMVAGMLSRVHPDPRRPGRAALGQVILARRIMEGHRHVFGVGPAAGFDEGRFVITDAYTGGSDALKKTWDAAPKHRDPAVNAFCRQALDYERGDDLLQLGLLDLPAFGRWLSREVPRSALAGLLVGGLLMVMGRAVLPLIHWADARQAFGVLRPWR
jgi:hypothetical protein